jgi:hypothetical protein
MSDSRKTPDTRELADLIRKLDAVMDEAASLRLEVTRQFTEQRHQQQVASRPGARARPRQRTEPS